MGQKFRILIAEDCRVSQFVTSGFVKMLGFDADVVNNGREALIALAKQKYDLILMDCLMPDIDGHETTREIHKRFAENERPRILALTAHGSELEVQKCLASGMDGVLRKPIDLNQLADALLAQGLSVEIAQDTPPSPFDRHRFLDNFQGLEDLIDSTVAKFVLELPKMLEAIEAAIEKGDHRALELMSHRLKGAISNFRAEPARLLAYRLEKFGRGDFPDDPRATFAELKVETERLTSALNDLVSSERRTA